MPQQNERQFSTKDRHIPLLARSGLHKTSSNFLITPKPTAHYDLPVYLKRIEVRILADQRKFLLQTRCFRLLQRP